MAATTANELIERALVKARVISPGEAIPAGKANQILDELNDLLESWALEKLMVLYDVLESFDLVAAQSSYTYGTGGDFDSARPIEIKDECFIRDGTSDSPVRLYDLSMYRRRTSKSSSGVPEIMAYNPEYPLGKVFLWPTPSSTDPIHVRAAKTVTTFATLVTSVDLQPGYRRAIVSSLAVEICPSFGKKVPDALLGLALQAKQSIKSANSIPSTLRVPAELSRMTRGGRFNILTGS